MDKDAENGEFFKDFLEYVDPVFVVNINDLDSFKAWCRSPFFRIDDGGYVYDFVIKRFEEKEMYELCAVLKEAKEEYLEGLIT